MDEYISKASVLKDSLEGTGEDVKESEMVLVMLTGLGDEYEARLSLQ